MNIARRGAGVAAALVLLALSACGDEKNSDMSSSATNAPQSNSAGGDQSISGGGEATADTAAPSAQSPSSEVPAQATDPGGRKLVITMTVGIEVADASAAADQVIALAGQYGGQLYNSSLDLSDPLTASGDLVFKVPPEQVEAFLGGLDPGIGRRTGMRGETADVTKQLTDLDAQILTAETSVDRVRALLDAATNLDDVITLEGELATRETHLEQLRAQQADLDSRVAQATITIHLTTAPKTLASQPDDRQDKSIGQAFRDGWKGFVTVLRGIALFVGYTAPFLVIGALAALAWWRLRRRWPTGRRSRSAAPPHPPAPGADQRTSTPDSEAAARIP